MEERGLAYDPQGCLQSLLLDWSGCIQVKTRESEYHLGIGYIYSRYLIRTRKKRGLHNQVQNLISFLWPVAFNSCM